MNDPDRLLHSGSTHEVELLRSAVHEGPSRASRARTLAALGVVSGILAVTTTAGVAAAAGAGSGIAGGGIAGGGIASGGGIAKASIVSAGTGFATVAKWLGIGLASTAVVVGGAYEVRSSFDEAGHVGSRTERVAVVEQNAAPFQTHPASAIPALEVDADAASVEPPSVAEATEKLAADAVEDVVAPVAALPAPPVPPAKAPPAPVIEPAVPTLADEVASLDEARTALASGNAHGAVALLEGHGQKFKGGALGPEAHVLSIEVFAQSGAHAQAIAAAESFLLHHPASPHRARVQSLLAASRAALAAQSHDPP